MENEGIKQKDWIGIIEKGYEFNDIISWDNQIDHEGSVKTATINFLNMMQDNNPKNRPNIDETLKFFNALNAMAIAIAEDISIEKFWLETPGKLANIPSNPINVP